MKNKLLDIDAEFEGLTIDEEFARKSYKTKLQHAAKTTEQKEATAKKMSVIKKGQTSPRKGAVLTDAEKEARRQKSLALWADPEYRARHAARIERLREKMKTDNIGKHKK